MALPKDGFKRELVNGRIVCTPGWFRRGYVIANLMSPLSVPGHLQPNPQRRIHQGGCGLWACLIHGRDTRRLLDLEDRVVYLL